MSAAPAIPEAEHFPTIQSLLFWRGRPEIAPLHGGLSNQSYTAQDETGRYVVRFGVDFPFHHVSRDREVIATQAAHAAGFAPELVYHAPGIMVSRFIAGKTYTAEDVQQNIGKVVGLVRRFHRDMATHIHGSGFAFWVFHVIRDYARTLAKGDHRMRDRLGEFTEIGNALEAVQIPLPVTIGHHDILPANLIDDGQKLWLIDFEYAGFGTGMFDLANMTSNADFTPEQADEALALYFDHTPDDGTIRAHRAMECASLLREAMWSMVSELFMTTPGIDYVAYSGEILAKTEAALDVYQTRFGKLI